MEQVMGKALGSAQMYWFERLHCAVYPSYIAGGLEVCCCTEQVWNLAAETITLQALFVFNLSTMGNSIHKQTKEGPFQLRN